MSQPLAYLDAAGPASRPISQLAWGLGGVAVAVVVIMGAALCLAIWRRRPRKDDPAMLEAVGRAGAGLAWIYLGVGVSTVVLAICTVWVLMVLGQVARPAARPPLTIQVQAHQWWWEARYLDPDPSKIFTTANEIHVPVGRPVRIELTSTDVIHSFWAPKLAGKMDVIPGVTNVTWLEADAPGLYRGQCGEYCGLQHARMGFYVVADRPTDFAAWQAHQVAPAAAPAGAVAEAGEADFQAHCASCHAVDGEDAGGIVGPNLTHFAQRATFAAGLYPNDPAHLDQWLADPDALKPGVKMPNPHLDPERRKAIIAYLETLS